jgi:hypothetical protein
MISLKYFIALIFLGSANAFAFDLPFFNKKYETIEKCKQFTPKVTNQDKFVNDICNPLFDTSKPLGPKGKGILLCMRNEINSATSIIQSRNVIFKCYEKFPSNHQNFALSVAQFYFKTDEEIAREQLINQPIQRKTPSQPRGMNCLILDDFIHCF